MSKTIDEKVVEMRFDNKHFEANVQTTLSTLDKLKAKLHLTGASKGLEEVNKASKKVDFSHMESSLASLEKRFSTTGIIGMTIIQNLTNAGLRFAKTLSNFSIGGILEGGKARATKIENAQFQIKGLLKDMDNADQRLKDIMSDVNYGVESTAYGLDAAATVAAQLVASGMEAGDGMRSALRGISGVAAMTNSTYEDIGRIYTKVAGNGRLMGEELLQLSSRGMNAAAVLAKSLNKTEAEVRDMVSKGKISFEMFSKAMDDAFGEHAKDANKTLNGVLSNIKAALAKIGADFYGPIIAENSPLVLFLNSVRERINDIRKTLAPITKEITDRINNMFTKIDTWFKNTKNVLGFSPFEKFRDILKTIQGPIEKVDNAIQTITKTMKDYENVVDRIIKGEFKNAPERFQLLTEAGYNWAYAQNLVNERLGNSFRYTTDYTPAIEGATTATGKLTDNTNDLIIELSKLSDEELRSKGYTEEQIEALKTLGDVAKKTGLSIDKLLELMNSDAFNTRFLIFNSFKNIGLTIVSILKSIGKAFGEVFSISPEGLFDIIAAFHKFTQLIRDRVEKNAEKLTRTLKGLFSIIHIITSVIGGAFKIALKIVNGVLESFGLTFLDVTAAIGDAIFAFDRWVTSNNTFVQIGKAIIEVIVVIVKWIGQVVTAIKDWAMQNEAIMSFINKIKNGFNNLGSSIEAWIKGLKETDNVPKYIFEGLINGLKSGAGKVFEVISTIGQGIIQAICNVLGIHSPSKVMFAIGGFLIAGLIAGMQDQSINLFDILKGIGNKIIEFFKQLDLGNVIAIGITSGILLLTKKMINIVDKLMAPVVGLGNLLTGLGDALTGLGSAATNFGKSMKYQGIAAIIKSIAISIGVLVAAVWILGNMNQDQLTQGGIALGVLAGGLLIFIGTLAALSKPLSNLKLPDMGKILAMTIGLSVAMYIIAKALKNISKINPNNMTSAINGLIACAVAMGILIGVLAGVAKLLKGTKTIEKMGTVFSKVAMSMLLIAVALRLISKVTQEDLQKAGWIIGGLIVLLGSLALINKFTAGSITKSADTIRSVGVALLLLVVAMKLCGNLKRKNFENAFGVVGVFLTLLFGMMVISKIFKKTEMIKVTSSILMAAIAIGLLALAVKLAGNMDPKQMKKGLICVGILGVLIGALIAVSKKSASFHGLTLIGVSAALIAMVAAVYLLGQLDPKKATNGLIAVGILTLCIDSILLSAKKFNPGENALKSLIAITAMLVLLVAAVVGLSFIDPQKLMTSAGSLSAVMLSLAIIIASTSKLKVGKNVIKTLAMITLIVAAMAGIIALLSNFTNPEGAIASAGALCMLMLALAGVIVIFNKIDGRKKVNWKIIAEMASLLIIVSGLAAILSMMGNTQNAIQNATALSILIVVMTGVVAAIGAIGKFLSGGLLAGVLSLAAITLVVWGLAAILTGMNDVKNAIQNATALGGLLLIMAVVVGILAVVGNLVVGVIAGTIALGVLTALVWGLSGILAGMDELKNATINAQALSQLLTVMTEALFKLSIVGPLALIADAAIFGLIGAITTIGIMATAVGAIMETFPQLKSFLDKGLPILEQIALGIGKILGNVVSGFLNSVSEELPHTAEKLSEFATKAMPFITIMSSVGDQVTNGVNALAGGILALAGANFVDAIASWFSNGESFGRLGTELSRFATGAMPFINTISGVKPEVMEGAKNMADAVLAFTKGNFWDTITGWLNGDNDIGEFGEKMAPLGTGLRQFVDELGEFTPTQVDTIKSACDALKSISEAADEIPRHGGIVQAFTGDNDIETFGKKFKPTGEALREFVAELTKDGTFDQSKIDIVKSGCEALKAIAEAAGEIPKHGGIAQAFAGDNDIEKFAGKLGHVAEGIRGFVWELQKDNVITEDSINKINAVNNIMWAIADLGKINLGDTSGKLEELGARLGSFGNKITEYVKGINTVSLDDLQSAKDKINKVIEIGNILSTVNSEPIEQFGEKLKNFATNALKEFVNGLKDSNPLDDAVKAIENFIQSVINAADGKKGDVKNKFNEIGEETYQGLNWDNNRGQFRYFSFNNLGKNFVEGFANGINNNLYLARDAGSAVGRRALEAAKASIDSHSPSKETYKLGKFFDQGFINGIKDFGNSIYKESYGIGDKARIGLSRAIQGVSNLISEGIDDDITIRPILDLSDVQSGVAAMNGMFRSPSIGVMSNLDAISSGMKLNRQNGGENIVSAIEKLGKNLGNTTGDTYNINGINYGDNTDVAEAIQTLVRAAKIERRT